MPTFIQRLKLHKISRVRIKITFRIAKLLKIFDSRAHNPIITARFGYKKNTRRVKCPEHSKRNNEKPKNFDAQNTNNRNENDGGDHACVSPQHLNRVERVKWTLSTKCYSFFRSLLFQRCLIPSSMDVFFRLSWWWWIMLLKYALHTKYHTQISECSLLLLLSSRNDFCEPPSNCDCVFSVHCFALLRRVVFVLFTVATESINTNFSIWRTFDRHTAFGIAFNRT